MPEIKTWKLKEKDEFIILACDGIWEQKSSQEIVDFVRAWMKKGMESEEIIKELFEDLISPDYTKTAGLGCDNMTCILIKLK